MIKIISITSSATLYLFFYDVYLLTNKNLNAAIPCNLYNGYEYKILKRATDIVKHGF